MGVRRRACARTERQDSTGVVTGMVWCQYQENVCIGGFGQCIN